MFLGGGLGWSEGGELGLLAGSTLGGGTVINSMACRPLPDDVRADWAAAGLEGVDGAEWDAYFDTVWTALGANSEATVYNRNAEVLIEGARRAAASSTTASPATPSSPTTPPTAATATPAASRAASARC